MLVILAYSVSIKCLEICRRSMIHQFGISIGIFDLATLEPCLKLLGFENIFQFALDF